MGLGRLGSCSLGNLAGWVVGRQRKGLVPGQSLWDRLRLGSVWQSLQVSWGAALWGAGPQGLGVGEPGGGARGLWQIHVCIWQSAWSQLSEAGPLASSRGGRQGPGDTPPPKDTLVPPPLPQLPFFVDDSNSALPSPESFGAHALGLGPTGAPGVSGAGS